MKSLQEASDALRTGDGASARRTLVELIRQHRQDEMLWWRLSASVEEERQRIYCLKRVLALNPANKEARMELMRLKRPQPTPPAKSRPRFSWGAALVIAVSACVLAGVPLLMSPAFSPGRTATPANELIPITGAESTAAIEPADTPTSLPEPTASPTSEPTPMAAAGLAGAPLPAGANLAVGLSVRSHRGVDLLEGVFAVNAEQHVLHSLTDVGNNLQGAAPDGKHLLVSQGRNLYVHNLVDGTQTLLSDDFITPCMKFYLLPDTCVNAAWLPVSDRVAFMTQGDDGLFYINVANADGRDNHRLTQPGEQPRGIYPSPDENKLYWKSAQPAANDVWRSMMDGTLPAANEVFTVWNLNMKISAVYGWKVDAEKNPLYTYRYEVRWTPLQGGESQLALNDLQSPVFSPGASVFAYYNNMGVFVAPLDQSAFTFVESAEDFRTLALSPDGAWLFTAANGKNILFNTIEHTRRDLDLNSADVLDAAWSPDGRQVLLLGFNVVLEQKNAWHYHELYLVDLSSGLVQNLGAITAPDSRPYFVEQLEWLGE